MADKSTSRPALTDIFDYTDYRKFLNDLYQARKATNRAMSYRYIAQKAGFNSPSFFGKILAGDTRFSHQSLMRLCEVFQLAGQEVEYFELLVNFEWARTQTDKQHFFKRMQGLRRRAGRILANDLESEWYLVPVLALCELGLFHGDFQKLSQLVTPAITVQEARLAIETLMLFGRLVKEPTGRYVVVAKQTAVHIEPPTTVSDTLVDTESVFGASEVSTFVSDLPEHTPDDMRRQILDLKDELKRLVKAARQVPSRPKPATRTDPTTSAP
jgi:uncharacterized protein (TIGR02147 family)